MKIRYLKIGKFGNKHDITDILLPDDTVPHSYQTDNLSQQPSRNQRRNETAARQSGRDRENGKDEMQQHASRHPHNLRTAVLCLGQQKLLAPEAIIPFLRCSTPNPFRFFVSKCFSNFSRELDSVNTQSSSSNTGKFHGGPPSDSRLFLGKDRIFVVIVARRQKKCGKPL